MNVLLLALCLIVHVNCTPKIIPVGCLFAYHNPLTSTGAVGSTQQVNLEKFSVVASAFDEINQGTIGILGLQTPIIDPTQYQFQIYNYSDTGLQTTALLDTINLVNQDNVAVIFGSTSSSISMIASLVAAPFYTPLISGSSTNAALSNKAVYPTFTRTVSSDMFQGETLAKIAYDFGWSNVAILHGDDSYSSGLAQDIQAACINLNITVLASIQFVANTATDISTQIQTLKTSGALIVYLIASILDAINAVYSLYQAGLVGPTSGYVYLGSDTWSGNGAFINGVNGYLGLSTSQKNSIMEGIMGTSPFAGAGTDSYNAWSSRFLNSQTAKNIWSMYGNSPSTLAITQTAYDSLYYDSVYLVAHAFSNLIASGQDPSIVTPTLRQKLLTQMKNVSFTGVSGPIHLDVNGDRSQLYSIYGYHNGAIVNLGLASATSSPYSNRNAAGALVYWPSGSNEIPDDALPVQPLVITSVSYEFKTALGAITIIAIIHSFAYFPILYINRKLTVFNSKSVTFILILLFGSLVALSGVLLLILEEGDVLDCGFGKMFLSVGASAMLACLLTKTYRVINFFNVLERDPFKIHSLGLGAYLLTIFCVAGLDFIIYALQMSVDKQFKKLVYVNGINEYHCVEKYSIWGILILVPKLLMVLLLVIAAIRMRNIPDQYNDTKIIGFIVYNMALIGVILVPLVYYNSDNSIIMLLQSLGTIWIVVSTISGYILSKLYYSGKVIVSRDASVVKSPAGSFIVGSKIANDITNNAVAGPETTTNNVADKQKMEIQALMDENNKLKKLLTIKENKSNRIVPQ